MSKICRLQGLAEKLSYPINYLTIPDIYHISKKRFFQFSEVAAAYREKFFKVPFDPADAGLVMWRSGFSKLKKNPLLEIKKGVAAHQAL